MLILIFVCAVKRDIMLANKGDVKNVRIRLGSVLFVVMVRYVIIVLMVTI